MKYLITYESAHWCGAAGTHVVVEAVSAEDAEDKAALHMEEAMRELFADEYSEDEAGEYEDECPYTVESVEEFDETHDQWEFYIDPTQAEFYPEIE